MRCLALIVLLVVGCESKPARSPSPPPADEASAKAPADDEPMQLVPTGEKKVFTPDPAKAAPKEVPPDGTLRLLAIQFVTSIPDLEQRTSDVEGMAALVKRAAQVVAEHDAARPGKIGAHAFVWLAVKPGGRVRAWLTGAPAIDAASASPIVEAIGKLPGPVTRGLIVLVVPLGRREETPPESFEHGPAAWQAATKPGDTVEDAVARVWPD